MPPFRTNPSQSPPKRRRGHLAVGGVEHAVVVVEAVAVAAVLAPVGGEDDGGAGAALDGEGEDEDEDLGAAVHGGGEDVVVLDEPLGVVLAHVELGEEADGEVAHDGGVDADAQPADVVGDDGGVPVPEAGLGEEPMEEVEGERDDEADEEGERDPLVPRAHAEHVRGERAPGDGLRVVLLHVLSRPDVGAFDREQDLPLVRDDGHHHYVVEDGADDRTDQLDGEGDPRGQLGVLRKLEILEQELTLHDRVVAEQREVHVGDRIAGVEVSTDHLNDGLDDELETGDGVLCTVSVSVGIEAKDGLETYPKNKMQMEERAQAIKNAHHGSVESAE